MVMVAVGIAGAGLVVGAGPAAAAAPAIRGIDVSGWQGTVDWGAVRRSGRLFAFAKATEGATFVDDTFARNRQGMAASGLTLRGFYHFARPDRNTPAAEASHFLRTVGPLGPGEVPVLDLEVAPGPGVGDWAAANNVELAYVPFYGSWLNRIEAQFTALRYFALDGTDHNSHAEQAQMIRRYIAWRNRHAHDKRLRQIVAKAETIKRAKVA